MLFNTVRWQVPERGPQNPILALLSDRTEKHRGGVATIATIAVIIGTLEVPSVLAEALFFMPACFVLGSVACKRGQRVLGSITRLIGVIAIFDLLFLACVP